MKIQVGLSGSLRRFIPEGAGGSPFSLEVAGGSSAADVLRILGVPAERAHIVTLNGAQVDVSTVVGDGQEISFFPPLAGGC